MTASGLTVLGLESSCDETSAALARARPEGGAEILANVVLDQEALHRAFGGVVPEIAARAHVERLDVAVEAALAAAGVGLEAVDAVAATAGPGLIGGVAAGLACAQGIAIAGAKPLVAVNHLEGHALSPRLSDALAYPYLLLLASGGHCQLLEIAGLGRYRRLGGSIDDSPGEAFDKLARHLGLGFPGGPEIERRARDGDPARFDLPRPLLDRPGADMSFSGLKTAARLAADGLAARQGGLFEQDVADLAASFQAAVCETLVAKTARAFDLAAAPAARFAVAGGVAANALLRASLEALAAEKDAGFVAPPLALCTDNGAMIAYAGLERLAAGLTTPVAAARARPRWPLDETAPPMLGAGKKGAKA